MPDYSYDTILVNGRPVLLNAILEQTAIPGSEFEEDSYTFIREWFGRTLMFQVQTSGSTGPQKTITFSREQILASAKATIQALQLRPAEVSLICLNTKFVAGKMMLVRAFINQMKVMLADPSSDPLEKIEPATNIDFTALVPLQLQTILEHGRSDRLNKIRNILIGGAPMNESLRTHVKKNLHTNVYATYGMTETITHIALERIGAEEDGVFHTLPGVAINADERNCLNIETSFLPGAIATNDVVEIISPRRFRWLGRWDNVINSGGIKVNPEILEDKLVAIFSRLNIQRRYFIASLPDPNLGERIVLFVEGKPLPNGVKDRISEEMLNNFLKFEIPRQIIVLERFSYTATGKINRLETLKQL